MQYRRLLDLVQFTDLIDRGMVLLGNGVECVALLDRMVLGGGGRFGGGLGLMSRLLHRPRRHRHRQSGAYRWCLAAYDYISAP